MAWFSRKKSDDADGAETSSAHFQVEPTKAKAWFDRAKTAADTRQYEYAIDCYLNGIKFDPTRIEMHKSLFEAAGIYRSMGGKPATSKEIRDMAGKSAVGRLAASELAWVKDATDASLALKFLREAASIGLTDVAEWASDKAIGALARAKKVNKSLAVGYIEAFEQLGLYDRAVEAAALLSRHEALDANLEARVRNLSAQAAMTRGRYEEAAGEEGGFRRSIRDEEGQRKLIEDESMAIGGAASASRLERAKAEWEASPDSPDLISKYADLLRKEDTDETLAEAIRVLLHGYKVTSEYRFRMLAGDVKLSIERRKLRARREAANASGSADEKAKLEQAERTLREMTAKEYEERVRNYPTDLRYKFELGRVLYELERYEEAIPQLQQSLEDARIRTQAQHMIGLCFLRAGWYDEAIQSLRDAVEGYEFKDDDKHLAMRYDLMEALEHHAREHDDLESAEEATNLASGIAMKRFDFRDIRERRETLRGLAKQLKG